MHLSCSGYFADTCSNLWFRQNSSVFETREDIFMCYFWFWSGLHFLLIFGVPLMAFEVSVWHKHTESDEHPRCHYPKWINASVTHLDDFFSSCVLKAVGLPGRSVLGRNCIFGSREIRREKAVSSGRRELNMFLFANAPSVRLLPEQTPKKKRMKSCFYQSWIAQPFKS